MLRTVVALSLVVLMLVCAVSAMAAGVNDKWIVYLKASDAVGNYYLSSACQYGTLTGATDTPVEVNNDGTNSANIAGNPSVAAVMGCFDLGAGVGNGYFKDLRAPMAATDVKEWHIRLWVQSNWSGGDVYLTGYNPAGTYGLNGKLKPIALTVANDPTGTYAAGSVLRTWNGTSHGSSTAPEFTAVFHNTNAIRGDNGGAYVDLVLGTAVPEPVTALSMLSLLGGFSILRRRRS